jgi:hypothetical protein
MRKSLIAVSLALVAVAGVARAEEAAEAIPPDFVQQFAPFAVQLIQQQFPNPAVKVEPNAEKTVGYHVKEQVGVVLMPDKNVTARTVEEAVDKEVPVAILATKSLSVQDKDTVVNGDRLAVADFNGMFKIPVFFLAVKGKGADRSLEVYSKDGKAVHSEPLKKATGEATGDVEVKLTNIQLEQKKLDASIRVSGYEGTVKLGVLDF